MFTPLSPIFNSAAKPDKHGNMGAKEGCDRCPCGSKYWENDRCIDCGAHILTVLGD